MSRTELIEKTIQNIELLPTPELKEISDFTDFLLLRLNERVISQQVSDLNIHSNSFKFLEEETDLYTVNDLKVKYGK
jgi:hypothetical protein